MLVKFKGIFFGCCHHDTQTTDPEDVDRRLKMRPKHDTILTTNAKTEGETLETQNNFLVTDHNPEDDKASIPKLKLVVIEGDIIPVDQEFPIKINHQELARNRKKDCCVFIGRQKAAKNAHNTSTDIVLEDDTVGERHCMIKYSANLKKYYIKDQGQGSGTFVRVEGKKKLDSGTIVSFSDTHMMIKISSQKLQDENKDLIGGEAPRMEDDVLNLRFLDGPKASQVFKFKPDEKVIKVGRMQDCQVKFDENNLSRYQCTMKYIDGAWYLFDGLEEKKSTNGTWIFLDSYSEVTNGSVIKIGHTVFRADLEY